jgi:Tol biopolymer transport system component
MFDKKEIQLSKSEVGHTLNTGQVFSPNDEWIVFDNRNNDGDIQITASIGMINVNTGEETELYNVPNQTVYGPGVGAASFSPLEDKVIFIHGIRNADEQRPYDFTRRTGVAIEIAKPHWPIFMDARDIQQPFTPGALRGGTHAHSWSGDGQWISFTYNDYVLEQLALKDKKIKDLRTIGLMYPGQVKVAHTQDLENNSGEMFSVLAATVTENPKSGSNEIDKAFDECWVGKNGYIKADGTRQHRAIAFQGNVRAEAGRTVTEIFVADIPANLPSSNFNVRIEGSENTRPEVPSGIEQRRITFTKKGIKGPRHWLRSNSDGTKIFFLSEDDQDIVQIYAVSPNGGNIMQVTHHEFSITSPINLSPDGLYLSYIGNQSVFITEIATGLSERLTPQYDAPENLNGAVVWSNDGKKLAYNRYVKTTKGTFLQIFLLKRP